IHSIEQPIRQGLLEEMANLCRVSPIPIALDEELIGVDPDMAEELLERVSPQYIILKPTLCGGFSGTDRWIAAAEKLEIGWWATSALESNVGLNAIARYLGKYSVSMPQGLGTGELYFNNIPSPLSRKGERLGLDPDREWEIPAMKWN
ncbi:MAG: o-succinylbenzoate synthase, partial [Duncaniella sp.]|nr:o-succinylbenzoate synthase [Duncaniella sp.]